jgi:hypothetical protein
MSGGSDSRETEVRLSPELRGSALSARSGAQNLYNQGTEGIYQGTGIVDENELIRQAQQEQLGMLDPDSNFYNMLNAQQNAFEGLLGAGDINSPLMQRQLADLADVVGEQFGRTIMPQINQGATAAGQYGSSRQGIAQGLAAGEAANAISRGATQAMLGGQQIGLQAQAMAPQSMGLSFLPSEIRQNIGQQRTDRDQLELADYIQQFNAPRQAQLQNVSEFTNLLASNPLMAESNTTTSTSSSGGLGQALAGGAMALGGVMSGNPALGFGGLGSMFGGGGGGSFLGSLFGRAPLLTQQQYLAASYNPFMRP